MPPPLLPEALPWLMLRLMPPHASYDAAMLLFSFAFFAYATLFSPRHIFAAIRHAMLPAPYTCAADVSFIYARAAQRCARLEAKRLLPISRARYVLPTWRAFTRHGRFAIC